jgi:hypothetical protein
MMTFTAMHLAYAPHWWRWTGLRCFIHSQLASPWQPYVVARMLKCESDLPFHDDLTDPSAELKKEAYEFKRDIVVGAENMRTGKTVAEKVGYLPSRPPPL